MKTKALSFIFTLLCCAISYGQNVHSYKLNNNNGHLFMTADICGEQREIMVESGIPALLIGQDFYERALAGGDLAFEPSQAKISLPVQNLYNESGHRTVSVDISNGRLSVGEIAESTGKCYKLHLDKKTGVPIVKAKVAISSQESKSMLKGNLIVDFGNPMLVFLMTQHRSVSKAIKNGKIIPQDACDANGRIVAQGIFADAVTVCGQEYSDVSIGLTGKMTSIRELGFLGIPFFNSAVAFDFDNGRMFVF